MCHGRKSLQRLAQHALGGRVRCTQLGVRGLQILQGLKQPVVLRVRDFRRVKGVVAPRVVFDQLTQGLRLRLNVGRCGHGANRPQLNTRWAAGLPAGRSRAAKASYKR